MGELTVQKAAESGGMTLVAAAAGGDTFKNNGQTLLVVKNGGAGAVAVTVTAQNTSPDTRTYGAVTKANGGGSVAAGAVDVFGPFPSAAFNNSTGQVAVTYDQVTSVTVAAVSVA